MIIHQAVFGLHMGCSRNVRGGWLTDWLLGGLNYQIEHHLFPNMPRASLRYAQPAVHAFCQQRGVTYTQTILTGSYRAALRHLHNLGAPCDALHSKPPTPHIHDADPDPAIRDAAKFRALSASLVWCPRIERWRSPEREPWQLETSGGSTRIAANRLHGVV